MRTLYQPYAAIASCCGRKRPTVAAEPAQKHHPQPVGRLFHVKRTACLAGFFIRINLRVHSVPDLPSNVIISLSQRHGNIPQSIVDAARVVSYTRVQANTKTPAQWGQATESDRKASWRI